MCTCKIQWVNSNGEPTPDNFPAIGHVYREAYTEEIFGRVVRFEQTERFPICARHAERLSAAGMHHWVFEPLPDTNS